MSIFLCLIGLTVLGISIFFAYKKRYNTKGWISIITFGVLLSVFFMVLPTQWSKSENALIKPLYDIISALLYSFKVLGGRQDISQLDSIGFTGVLRYIYILINYSAFIAAPILGSSLILSFVGDTLSKIRYTFPAFKKSVIVFSELNENSYLIAKCLRENDKKNMIVFCSTKDTDASLMEKARHLHSVNLYKKCEDIRIKSTAVMYEFYLVCDNEDKNAERARLLIEKYAGIRDKAININAFAKNGPETVLLENIVESMYSDNDKNVWQNINLTFIDKTELFCNNIVYENPLYKMADEKKNISIMIIGCGKTGMCMLKTVLWSGQIYGHTLKVRVYDKDSEKCRALFEKKCPELDRAHGYDVEFINADVETNEFENLIVKNGQAENATVAYIFTGNDEFNINAAVSLYGTFRKSRAFGETPPIFTWMNGSEKLSNFTSKKGDFLKKRNIRITGNIESIYSEKMLFRTMLEREAFGAHLCYCSALNKDKNSKDYIGACKSFINKDYSRRSSMATALHFDTKLHIFDMWMKEHVPKYKSEDLKMHFEKQFRSIERKEVTEIACILAENEHKRWNAFMRSEGYRTADIETMKKYYNDTKKDRDDYSKLHLCITDWDCLDEAEAVFNSLSKEKRNFKESDFLICQKIFEIREYAEKLLMEDKPMYVPKPIDTKDVELPEELLRLTEKIAENVHEVWAEGRIREGWTYGERRDDINKKTPCLVPYDELDETEKAYDRNTALETVKLIVSLGYKISK